MAENLNIAFTGMVAVFIILAIVVYLGRFLIFIVNRYYSKPVVIPNNKRSQAISNKKLAVLSSVVDHVTNNKGIISSITKV